jgi:hypothetical protein
VCTTAPGSAVACVNVTRLTAFGVDIREEIGVRDSDGDVLSNRPRVFPIVVSEDLQNVIASRSRPMPLSTNGVYI